MTNTAFGMWGDIAQGMSALDNLASAGLGNLQGRLRPGDRA